MYDFFEPLKHDERIIPVKFLGEWAARPSCWINGRNEDYKSDLVGTKYDPDPSYIPYTVNLNLAV